MEVVDVEWCKGWIVIVTFENKVFAQDHIQIDSITTPLQVSRAGEFTKQYYFLQTDLANKKVQTLEAQEHPIYQAEVSQCEDIGRKSNNGSTINIHNIVGTCNNTQ